LAGVTSAVTVANIGSNMGITNPFKRVNTMVSHSQVPMLTAHDEVQYVTDAISAGAKGYVLKKVRQEELIKIIHDVIDHSEPFYSRTDVFCVGCKAICKLRSEQQNYCLSNSLK
jgi:DNA-binding NarL/FixJ family response regulator